MKPEIYPNMTNADYHARKDALSNSMLSEFMRSPAHLQASLRAPAEQSKSQRDGELIHAAILEPKLLTNKYVASPDPANFPGALVSGDDLKVRCKELGLPVTGTKAVIGERILSVDPKAIIWDNVLQSLCEKHKGKTFLRADELQTVERLVESVYSHADASHNLCNGVAEQSIFWTDPETGVKCRCRPDYYIREGGILVDVKSTEDASLWGFQKQLYNLGYYRQLAFYSKGLEAAGMPVSHMRIVAVEKFDPFAVQVFELDITTFWRAYKEINEALYRYADCLRLDEWPAYPIGVQMIGLPAYAH